MATAAFLGHLFPIFSRFRGGKGVATAFGAFLALEPRAAGLGLATYALAYGLSRISSVGSLTAVLSFPVWLYLSGARRPSYVLAGVLLVGIVAKHHANISRLWRGQERKL
jgi:glycerol-3-phosphate acyltransferase PlsY